MTLPCFALQLERDALNFEARLTYLPINCPLSTVSYYGSFGTVPEFISIRFNALHKVRGVASPQHYRRLGSPQLMSHSYEFVRLCFAHTIGHLCYLSFHSMPSSTSICYIVSSTAGFGYRATLRANGLHFLLAYLYDLRTKADEI
jgi:hypothetical protein